MNHNAEPGTSNLSATRYHVAQFLAPIAAGVILVSACSSHPTSENTTSASSAPVSELSTMELGSSVETADTAGSTIFTFNALGGGSSIIKVYAGYRDKEQYPQDGVVTGTFEDRQTTPAVCRAVGRTVISDPTVGEQPRRSDIWVGVEGPPGKKSFATMTYGDMDPTALASLPECTP